MSVPDSAGNYLLRGIVEQPAEEHHPANDGDHTTEKDFADEFLPIRILGRGAMGTVLLAVHRTSKQLYAIKAISKQANLLRPRSLQRAQTELEVLTTVDYHFLPTLHSHFESAGYSFLVLNFCSGGDLNALRYRQPERRFSEAAIRFYGAELILALERLHNLGYVYRDLKPENVLLSEGGHVVLTDFDLCLKLPRLVKIRVERDVPETVTPNNKPSSPLSCFRTSVAHGNTPTLAYCMPVNCGQNKHGGWKILQRKDHRGNPITTKTVKHFVGTEEYVAPEVLSEDEHDFSVDWWSFGILLYELTYGKTPFKGTWRKNTFYNILHRDPEFPGPWSPLQDLIRKLLVKEPERRLGYYHGAIELMEHAFFRGVQWDELQNVARPPVVPGSVSAEKQLGEGDRLSSDLETFLGKVDRSRKDSLFSSTHDRVGKSSEGESESEVEDSPADQSSSSNSHKYQRLDCLESLKS